MEKKQATLRLSKKELKHKTVTLLVTADLGMRFYIIIIIINA